MSSEVCISGLHLTVMIAGGTCLIHLIKCHQKSVAGWSKRKLSEARDRKDELRCKNLLIDLLQKC